MTQTVVYTNNSGGTPLKSGVNTTVSTVNGTNQVDVATATASVLGVVKPDGTTISVNGGVLSVYSAPTVLTFVNNQNSLEIGTTVTSTLLTWTLGGAAITGQSIDNLVGAIQTNLRSFTNAASYTTSRTYNLTVTDGVTTNTGATSVTFYSKEYWGASAQTASTITDGQIIALSGAFATSRATTQTISTSSTYIFFCYPASFGSATFTVNGFPDAGWTLVTRNFQNASGGIVSYNIYQHTLATIGNFTVQVQ